LTYEQRAKHSIEFPEHTKNILTSKWYGTEAKFLTLARDLNKVAISNGKEAFENPFKRKMRRKRLHSAVDEGEQEDELNLP
jgi:hypothetical protein